MHRSIITAVALLATSTAAGAQSLGTFRWQMQPYCNVVTLDVTQTGSGFRLEGTDDQCGAGADRASAIGTAFPNPDGTIGIGLTIITSPTSAAAHVDAQLAPGGFSGSWRDDSGQRGAFTFTPGAGTGGNSRPTPSIGGAVQGKANGSIVAIGNAMVAAMPSGDGTRLVWHAGKAAFRAGGVVGSGWDDANIGRYSAGFGFDTRASGSWSFASGYRSVASGDYSLAHGDQASASGPAAIALGTSAFAQGFRSVAIGSDVQATSLGAIGIGASVRVNGANSVALGRDVTTGASDAIAIGTTSAAFGPSSVVLGFRARTNASANGSFVFGDTSSTTDMQSSTPNQFLARFAGGYVLWSTANTVYPTSPGVQLAPGGSAWSSLSDVNSKEHFTDLDGESVLTKLAAMPVRTWNYKAQDAAIRHAGPTAQDFFAAFGLGEDERRISTIDADGIALAGVKALVARTEALAARAERLEQENHALRQRLERLEGPLVRR